MHQLNAFLWAKGYMEQGSKRLSVQVPGAGSHTLLPGLADGSPGDGDGFLEGEGAMGTCIGSGLRPGLYRGVPISD